MRSRRVLRNTPQTRSWVVVHFKSYKRCCPSSSKTDACALCNLLLITRCVLLYVLRPTSTAGSIITQNNPCLLLFICSVCGCGRMTVTHTPITAIQPAFSSNSTRKRAVQQGMTYAQPEADEIDRYEWATSDRASKSFILPETAFQKSYIARALLGSTKSRHRSFTKSSISDGSVSTVKNHKLQVRNSAKRALDQHGAPSSSPYQSKRLHCGNYCDTEATEYAVVSEWMNVSVDCEPSSCDVLLNNNGLETAQQETAMVQSSQSSKQDGNADGGEPIAYSPIVQELKDAIDSDS